MFGTVNADCSPSSLPAPAVISESLLRLGTYKLPRPRLPLFTEIITQQELVAFERARLIVDAVIEPLSVIFNCRSYCELLEVPSRKALVKNLLEEVTMAAILKRPVPATHGMELHAVNRLWKVVQTVCLDDLNDSSPMAADVRAGVETDIDFINGYVAEKASLLGIPTPINNALLKVIKRGEGLLDDGVRRFAEQYDIELETMGAQSRERRTAESQPRPWELLEDPELRQKREALTEERRKRRRSRKLRSLTDPKLLQTIREKRARQRKSRMLRSKMEPELLQTIREQRARQRKNKRLRDRQQKGLADLSEAEPEKKVHNSEPAST